MERNSLLPDGQKVSKDAIIYKHGEPKITMTYINDKVVNGVTEKTAGSAYTSGEWSNGVKVRIDFNTEDVINLCREHDTEQDWSYNMPYKDLKAHAEKWIETNEIFKKT